MAKQEKITFTPEGEEPVEFYVLEQTRIGGIDYILVTDEEEGDGEALILKDMSRDGEPEGLYTIVSDDQELEAVDGVFENMLEDVELENAWTKASGPGRRLCPIGQDRSLQAGGTRGVGIWRLIRGKQRGF